MGGSSVVSEPEEAILELLKVSLSDHSHDIYRANIFVITVDILSGCGECFDGVVRVKHNLRPHVQLQSTQTF